MLSLFVEQARGHLVASRSLERRRGRPGGRGEEQLSAEGQWKGSSLGVGRLSSHKGHLQAGQCPGADGPTPRPAWGRSRGERGQAAWGMWAGPLREQGQTGRGERKKERSPWEPAGAPALQPLPHPWRRLALGAGPPPVRGRLRTRQPGSVVHQERNSFSPSDHSGGRRCQPRAQSPRVLADSPGRASSRARKLEDSSRRVHPGPAVYLRGLHTRAVKGQAGGQSVPCAAQARSQLLSSAAVAGQVSEGGRVLIKLYLRERAVGQIGPTVLSVSAPAPADRGTLGLPGCGGREGAEGRGSPVTPTLASLRAARLWGPCLLGPGASQPGLFL